MNYMFLCAEPVPVGAPSSQQIKYVIDNIGNETCIIDVLEYLVSIMNQSDRDSELLENVQPVSQIVLWALEMHIHVERIVLLGLKFLALQLSNHSMSVILQ